MPSRQFLSLTQRECLFMFHNGWNASYRFALTVLCLRMFSLRISLCALTHCLLYGYVHLAHYCAFLNLCSPILFLLLVRGIRITGETGLGPSLYNLLRADKLLSVRTNYCPLSARTNFCPPDKYLSDGIFRKKSFFGQIIVRCPPGQIFVRPDK